MSKVVKTFRIGAVSVDIWKNKERGRPPYTAIVGRDFRTDAGKYITISTLNASDLLNAAQLLQLANAWIMKQ